MLERVDAQAEAVEQVIQADQFPVVPGRRLLDRARIHLALKRRGRYGLLFVDGHADFYQPEVNPNGEAASMDLAFATGIVRATVRAISRHPLRRAMSLPRARRCRTAWIFVDARLR